MNTGEILIYQNNDCNIKLDVCLEQETVWLTQDQIAVLFGKSKSTINEHIKNIYSEGELEESASLLKFGISEFQQKAPNYYNHDVIISTKKAESQADTSALEQQIDNMVYKLYELTYEEVKVIDPEYALTEEEYETIKLDA